MCIRYPRVLYGSGAHKRAAAFSPICDPGFHSGHGDDESNPGMTVKDSTRGANSTQPPFRYRSEYDLASPSTKSVMNPSPPFIREPGDDPFRWTYPVLGRTNSTLNPREAVGLGKATLAPMPKYDFLAVYRSWLIYLPIKTMCNCSLAWHAASLSRVVPAYRGN